MNAAKLRIAAARAWPAAATQHQGMAPPLSAMAAGQPPTVPAGQPPAIAAAQPPAVAAGQPPAVAAAQPPAVAAGHPPVLSARNLVKRFGGITASARLSLDIAPGARQALIGPNGAGKTTLINLLTGVLAPSAGSIVLDGQDITRLAPHRRVRRGLVRSFQINQLYDGLTPLEALALTVAQQRGEGGHCWQPLGARRAVAERCAQLLEQLRLAPVMNQPTRQLPYGKRRLLEIALALACAPRVLLLDEPMAGVPAGERGELLQTLAALPAQVAVLLIEHDMDRVFRFASRVTVLVNGAVLTEGTPEQIARNAQVRAVYLGHGQDGDGAAQRDGGQDRDSRNDEAPPP